MRNSSTPEAQDDASRDAERRAAAKAVFHLRMRAQGIRDLHVLRAIERIPRESFVSARYANLAARDLPIPMECGQTMLEPSLVARMVEALRVDRTHRVLEIGSGSGYGTAILASLGDDVIGTERYQTLANAAQERLDALGIRNAVVVWSDGLAVPAEVGPFDRILVHGTLTATDHTLADHLAPGGRLVCGTPGADALAARIVCYQKDSDVLTETVVCERRLPAIETGMSSML